MSDTSGPRWSLITVTYNSAGALQRFWKDVELTEDVEWVVVDNNSSDNSIEVARSIGARVIGLDENLGFGTANNVGFQKTNSQFVAFVNPDVTPKLADLAKLEKVLADNPRALVAPQLIYDDGSLQPNGRGKPYLAYKVLHRLRPPLVEKAYRRYAQPGQIVEVDWLTGAVIAGAWAHLASLGPWDEEFFVYYEDTDLGLRNNKSGGKNLLVGDANWVHGWARETSGGLSLPAWRNEFRSASSFYRRYPALLGFPLTSNHPKTHSPIPPDRRPRTVAFYLPQFHAIPENDEWWGKGFTEWTNVRKALPLFDGHDQPRKPADLGEYNLLEKEIHQRQSELAREYGVDAFCQYFYWFDGARLLEKPIDMWREDESLLPYCLSWANENWTRRWDGKEHEVLMPQSYNHGYEDYLFDSLLPHFQAKHYLEHDGKPIFLVHRPDQVPNLDKLINTFQNRAKEAGLPGIYFVGAETNPAFNPTVHKVDAMVEFPPVGSSVLSVAEFRPVKGLTKEFNGRLLSYRNLAKYFQSRPEPKYVRYPCVIPQWDNSPRRGANATVIIGATPHLYSAWLSSVREKEVRLRGSKGYVFINAWNEWAEGAYLEPDSTHGNEWLWATRWDVFDLPNEASSHLKGNWSKGHTISLLRIAMGSVLHRYRMLVRFVSEKLNASL